MCIEHYREIPFRNRIGCQMNYVLISKVLLQIYKKFYENFELDFKFFDSKVIKGFDLYCVC